MGWTDVHSVRLQSCLSSHVRLPVLVTWWLIIPGTAWDHDVSWALLSAVQSGQRTQIFVHPPICFLLQVTEETCCSRCTMHSCREAWALLTQSSIVGVRFTFKLYWELSLPCQDGCMVKVHVRLSTVDRLETLERQKDNFSTLCFRLHRQLLTAFLSYSCILGRAVSAL